MSEFEQNDLSKKFVRDAEALIKQGLEPTYKTIAEKLDWNNNALSLVVKGKRDIPQKIYKKFVDLYKPVEIEEESVLYKLALQNHAILRVVLRTQAELLANQRKEAVTKTLSDLELAVRAETQKVSERLQ